VRYFGINAQTLKIHKSNHITFGFIGARTANELGADADEIRRHGRWCGDRLSSAYLSPISRVTVRVLAGFSKDRGTYFLERANLEVPATLLKQIFPQVDEWEGKMQVATRPPGIATASFLQVMRFLKTVILQDSVLLSQQFPSSALWNHPVFRSPEYQEFRAQCQRALAEIQNPFSVQLQAVLPQVHEGLLSLHRTVVTTSQQLSQSLEPAIRNLEARLETSEQDSRRLASLCQFLQQCSEGLSEILHSDPLIQPIQPSSSSSPPPPSSSLPRQQDTPTLDPVPHYRLSRTISTVRELWQEWDQGLPGGQPAVRVLESRFGAKWRREAAERKFFSRRLRVVKFILRRYEDLGSQPGQEGLTIEDVVSNLSDHCEREGITLNQLSDQIAGQTFPF
jgi:hypothetical protein